MPDVGAIAMMVRLAAEKDFAETMADGSPIRAGERPMLGRDERAKSEARSERREWTEMDSYYADARNVLKHLERERNAHVREGQLLRMLDERRDEPTHRPTASVSRLGLVDRLRRAFAAPARSTDQLCAGTPS